MVKRKLSDEEKRICERNIKSKEEKKRWLKYQLKYYELMMNEGLELNYQKTRREFAQQQKEYQGELDAELKIIEEVERQIKEGVEIKDIKPEKADDAMRKYTG